MSDNSQGKQCLIKASSNGNPERGLVLSLENVFFQLVSHFLHAMFLRTESNDFAYALNRVGDVVRKPATCCAKYLRSFVGGLATEGRNTNPCQDKERCQNKSIEQRDCYAHPHDSPNGNDYRCCQGHQGVGKEHLNAIDVFRDSRQKVTGVGALGHRRGLRFQRIKEVITQEGKRTESNVVSRILLEVAEQCLEQRHNHQRPHYP